MKKLYFTVLALLISTMVFSQVIVNEGYETGNTVGQAPVGWICSDNGWKAGITIPDDNEARGRKPHTGDWYMYASYNSDVWIYKEISVTAGNYYRVQFWYSTWHVDHFNLEVKAGTSASPSAMGITVVPDFIVANEEWEQTSGVFQATSSGSFYVGFHSVGTNSPWYLSIDDVIIEQTAQYYFDIEQLTADTTVYFGEAAPLRFLLSNTGEQNDTYSFTNTSSLPIEFYQDGAQVTSVSLDYNTSIELVAKATLPMNLTDNQELHATFDVTSAHSAPVHSADFKITALAPVSTFPLMEGFDGNVFPPAGWQNLTTNGNYIYERVTSNDWPACTPHNGSTAMARFYCYTNPEGKSALLVTPKMQLSATDNNVRYWIYRNFNNNINRPDRINVYYSPTTDVANGTLLGTVHRNTMMEPVVGENSDWYEYSYTFDSPEGFGFIIFEAVSGYGWNLCIDDIFINSTNIDNNPPTVVFLNGTQTYADTEMELTLRVYDESGLPNQMQATYTVDGQSYNIAFNRISRANSDYMATLPAKPNHTTGSIVFHLIDELGNAAESDSYELHWDWQRPILHEGFEDEQFPPAGWSIESLQMSWFSWYRFRAEYASNYFGDEYYVVPPEGERMAGVEWDESEEWGPQDESLITPLIAINRPTVLTFENSCQYGVSQYHDHYKVDVLNTNTGSWSTLWDAVDQPEWMNNFQEPVSVDLSQYQGQNIRLRWRAHNNGSDILTFSWFIDNVKVIVTDTIDNVKETMSLQTSIYPNPTDNALTIKADNDIQHINIYNVIGIKVMDMTINNKEAVIDLTNLESGMYLIEIQGIKESGIKTFIKK